METKNCKYCNKNKKVEEFRVKRNICHECAREKDKIYTKNRYLKDRDKVKARNEKWRKDNMYRVKERNKNYRQVNKEKLLEGQRITRSKKPEHYKKKQRDRAKERRKKDLNFRLKDVLRKRIRNALVGGFKSDRTLNMLGCSLEEFKIYLEKKFKEEMTWDNYGKNGWHIDHIKPCVAFDLTKENEQRECFHYTNMQPLWCSDNWSKGSKYLGAN